MRKCQRQQSRGQSIVEFALASIVLFLLLTAVVDVGLIFLTHQTMINAVKEGLSYGSYRPVTPNASNPSQPLPNNTNIRYRVRYVGSDPNTGDPAVSFINMLDLNGNDISDDAEPSVLDQYIAISAYPDGNQAANCQYRDRNCWLRIDLQYDYKLIFPLAPVFGDTLELHVVRDQQIIRSSQ